MWPLFLGIWVAGEGMQQWFLTQGIYILLAFLSVVVALNYWFFRFKVEDDRIQLHSGVLRRKRLTLEFDRVQQADIAQPFYFRPFGISTMGLESAGSSSQEVHIPGLPLAEAESLKLKILAHRNAVVEKVSDTEDSAEAFEKTEEEHDYELSLSRSEVARYGLMHNGLLFLLPIIAPLTQNLLAYAEDWLLELDSTAVQQMLPVAGDSALVWIMVAGGIVMVALGIAIIFTGSAIIATVRYWDYRLTRVGDQFQYRAGLATIKTRGFRFHKLQLVSVTQGVVARLLKRYSMYISKAGDRAGSEQGDQSFLIPVLTGERLAEIKQQLDLSLPTWTRIHPLYILWRTVLSGTMLFIVLSVVLIATERGFMAAVLAYPVYALIVWRRWLCLGYFQDSQWLAVKTGFVGHQVQWLPVVKAQKVLISQPPWLSYLRLANLHVWGANGNLSLPFVPVQSAETMRDDLLLRVSTFKGRWL